MRGTRLPNSPLVDRRQKLVVHGVIPKLQSRGSVRRLWKLLKRLGTVPRVMSGTRAAIGRWRGGRVKLTEGCHAFRGTIGAQVLVCKLADPEAKGLSSAP